MTTGRLPDHEQRALEQIEAALRRDRRLDRRLRTLRLRRCPDLAPIAAYRPRVGTVGIWLTLSVTLMILGIRTSEPWLIWTFAAVWPVTLYGVFRLLCRWSERPGPGGE
ncbi:DUF3040 domain-containing protein [Streptomyces phyllanthi]|uniref:DUF3040 domain-containing protein n=1 Tax=Streptomyces phyllanthi TaxID=1803180 RepID=A0A5N8W874_9ACTN|nr:DUF3040 domain-containing protein [Streptomyces phyllanthi]MPY42335.1 DUF3040 domain-containing protein [Streptomyces phyllanthi]